MHLNRDKNIEFARHNQLQEIYQPSEHDSASYPQPLVLLILTLKSLSFDSLSSCCKRRGRSNVRSTTNSQTRRQSSRRASLAPSSSDPTTLLHPHCRFEKECTTLQKESKAYLDAVRGASTVVICRVAHANTPPFFPLLYLLYRDGIGSNTDSRHHRTLLQRRG